MKDDYELWVSHIKKELSKKYKQFSGKRCVLFGASDTNRIAVEEMKKLGIKADYVIDNNKRKTGSLWMGIPVVSPSFLQEDFDENTLVLICGVEIYEKSNQIFSLGYEQKNVLLITPQRKSRYCRIKDFVKVWNVYRKIRREGRGKHLFFLPLEATGDAYLTGLYLGSFIREKGYINHCIVVVSENVRNILRLFGFYDIMVISSRDGDLLREAVSCFGESRLDISYLMFWGLYSQNLIRIEEYCDASFHEIFRSAVLGYQDMEKAVLPEFCHDVRGLFEKEGFAEGKTVLLSPYATSFENELDISWWERLAFELTQKGYKVCTNSAGMKEAVVNGTTGVSWSYKDIVPLLDLAGYFVGVRSGLCEVISSSSCKKVILYQKYMSKNKMSYFSLNHMGLCDDAVEMKLGSCSDEKIMQNIIEVICDKKS